MEQNHPIVTKKLWNMVRLAFFMLRKGICKNKILLDLNLMMKKAKITGKSSATRLAGITSHDKHATFNGPREYEFNCNNTPLYRHLFTNKRKNHDHQMHDHYMMMSSSPSFEDTSYNLEVINQVLETMLSNKNHGASQLSITDSPFALRSEDDKCDQHVNDAAEEFIKEFYSQLKGQNS